MSDKSAYLRSRAHSALLLAVVARDREISNLLLQVSEELEEEALLREMVWTRRERQPETRDAVEASFSS